MGSALSRCTQSECKTDVAHYPDGTVKHELVACPDSSYSRYRSFYGDGTLHQDKQLVAGMQDGLVTTYDSLGRLAWRANYLRDTLNGPYVDYYPSGSIRTRSGFFHGLQDGEFVEYFESGVLKSKVHYEAGKRKGEFLEYYPNGALLMRARFELGFIVEYVEYDSLGTVIDSKHALD